METTHPKLARLWHPNKNGKLTPRNVKAGSGMNAWWLCSEGHEWQATPHNMKKPNRRSYCPICKTKWQKLSFSSPWSPLSSSYYARRNIDVIQVSHHDQWVNGLVVIPRIRKRLNARLHLNLAEPFPVLLPEELCAESLFIYCNESRIWWLLLVVGTNHLKKRPRKKRGQSNRECGIGHHR